MQDQKKVLEQLDNQGILRITLNDSQKRNALSEAMMSELQAALTKADADNNVRVIILAAEGPVFSSGHDLKELNARRQDEDNGRAYFEKILSTCSDLMMSIVTNRKPIIAEVSGIATAAGCQLVASCDLAIVSKEAQFSTPGVHIGLFCSTPMVALSRNIENKFSMEMLLTGQMIKAKKAKKIGLVNKVVKAEKLSEKSQEMAQLIASKSSMTLAVGKEAFYMQKEMPLEKAYQYASQVMVENMLKEDAKEGFSAFLEKRQAVWSDQ